MGLMNAIADFLYPSTRIHRASLLFEPFTPDGCQYEVHPLGIYIDEPREVSVDLRNGTTAIFCSSGREIIPVLTKYHPT